MCRNADFHAENYGDSITLYKEMHSNFFVTFVNIHKVSVEKDDFLLANIQFFVYNETHKIWKG